MAVVRALLLSIADELRIGIVADIATALSVTKATTANAPAGAANGAAVPSALDAVFAALLRQLAPDPIVVPSPANDPGQPASDSATPLVQTDPSPQSAPQAPFDSSTLIALLQNAGPLSAPADEAPQTPAPDGNVIAKPAPKSTAEQEPDVAVALKDPQAAPSQPQSGDPAREAKSAFSPETNLASATLTKTDNADTVRTDEPKPVAKTASKDLPDANTAIVILSQAVPQQAAPPQQQSAASDAASAITIAASGGKPAASAPSKDGKPALPRTADQIKADESATSDSVDTQAKSTDVKQAGAPDFEALKADAHGPAAQTAPVPDANLKAQSSGSGQSDGNFSSAAASTSVQAPAGTSSASAISANLQVAPQHHDAATTSSLDSLAVTIAAKSADGARHFDIRLDPPDLGRVDVRLSMDDSGNARASLIVDKPQTLELLQRDASNLNRALSEAGLSLSNNGLNFSLRGQDRQDDGGSVAQGRSRSLSVKAVVGTDALGSGSISSFAPNSVRLDIRV